MFIFKGLDDREFQSTLPAGGATAADGVSVYLHLISIHAPRGGSDHPLTRRRHDYISFQSTLPAGGATRLVVSLL